MKGTTQTDENPAQETGQVGGQEEEEEENAVGVTEVEEDESMTKGYQDAKNPGKLIIGNQRYLSVSAVSLVKTFPYWYTCEIIKLGRKSVENIYFKFVSNTPLCNFKCLLR